MSHVNGLGLAFIPLSQCGDLRIEGPGNFWERFQIRRLCVVCEQGLFQGRARDVSRFCVCLWEGESSPAWDRL